VLVGDRKAEAQVDERLLIPFRQCLHCRSTPASSPASAAAAADDDDDVQHHRNDVVCTDLRQVRRVISTARRTHDA